MVLSETTKACISHQKSRLVKPWKAWALSHQYSDWSASQDGLLLDSWGRWKSSWKQARNRGFLPLSKLINSSLLSRKEVRMSNLGSPRFFLCQDFWTPLWGRSTITSRKFFEKLKGSTAMDVAPIGGETINALFTHQCPLLKKAIYHPIWLTDFISGSHTDIICNIRYHPLILKYPNKRCLFKGKSSSIYS